MHTILMFGAGRSATAAIEYFIDNAAQQHWHLVLADSDITVARQKIGNSTNATAVAIDINNDGLRMQYVQQSDIVISLLPPSLHLLVAKDCVKYKKSLVTASYISHEIQQLHTQAIQAGIVLMNECGLDPGLDHMSAMKIIDHLKYSGSTIHTFKSYCGGLVAPASNNNPWGYKFSWNPRNVIVAGQSTATMLHNGKVRYIPYNRIFEDIAQVNVKGFGAWDGYANRDSLSYRTVYGLQHIQTMLRGTLRFQGYCHAWNMFVKLGYTDDSYKIIDSANTTYATLTEALLPAGTMGHTLEDKLAHFFNVPLQHPSLQQVLWCGIASSQLIGAPSASPAMALQLLLEQKWLLQPHDRDMIIMQHQFGYTTNEGANKNMVSELIMEGDDALHTAMSKTVGLPLAITAKLILQKTINLQGVHLPVLPQVYNPVLHELKQHGVVFHEYDL